MSPANSSGAIEATACQKCQSPAKPQKRQICHNSYRTRGSHNAPVRYKPDLVHNCCARCNKISDCRYPPADERRLLQDFLACLGNRLSGFPIRKRGKEEIPRGSQSSPRRRPVRNTIHTLRLWRRSEFGDDNPFASALDGFTRHVQYPGRKRSRAPNPSPSKVWARQRQVLVGRNAPPGPVLTFGDPSAIVNTRCSFTSYIGSNSPPCCTLLLVDDSEKY